MRVLAPWHFCLLLGFIACGRSGLVTYSSDASVADASVQTKIPDAGALDSGRPEVGIDAGEKDGGPKPCLDGQFSLSAAEPEVMLVLDRSGSMEDSFVGGTTTCWEGLRAALRATLPGVDQKMQLGVMFFPIDGADDCEIPSVVGLPPGKGQANVILATLANTEPRGATPTEAALIAAHSKFANRRSASTARVMVLATDGEPTCSTLFSTIDRLQSFSTAGVPTYVVGILRNNGFVLTDALNQMALAGGRPQAGVSKFYSATSTIELQNAFTSIRDQVGACSFLTDSVPDAQGAISVSFGGVPVAFDASGLSGWSWTDRSNGELALHGSECTRAIAQPALLQAVIRCGG